MAYKKKSEAEAKAEKAFQELKADLSAGTAGGAYIFYGEEGYLRDYYLGELRKTLVGGGFEEFNYHVLEEKEVTIQALTEMAEAMPMMSERTLLVAKDLDLFKLPESQRERLIALIEDLPPYCCLVFVYDALEYKPNKAYKKLCGALEKRVRVVKFSPLDQDQLLKWIAKRFRALGKEIDRRTAEYLIFVCGGLMTGLVPEITKIGTYAKGERITERDIDAVADPILSAEVFKMTDAVLRNDYDEAARLLGNLLKMQTEPIEINAALGGQFRRIYTARVALDAKKDRYWLMDLWGAKSDYQPKLWLSAARRAGREWCGEAVKASQALDLRLKSQRGVDPEGELKLLLARLGALKR